MSELQKLARFKRSGDMTSPKTLRDEFAMAAISGLLSNPTIGFESFDAAAKAAGKMADAMLAERKKGKK